MGQGVVTGIERLQKAGDLILGGQVAQADAPRGQRVAPVMAHGEHRPGGQPVRRAGRFDRDAHAFGVQLSLEHGALHVLYAQVQDLRHGVLRAVDAYLGVLCQLCAQAGVQGADVFHPGGQLGHGLVQCQRQRAGQRHGGRAAAVDGGAFAAVDEGLQRKAPALDQHTDAVQPVEFVGGQAHGVDAVERNRQLAHGLGGVYMKMAVGAVFQKFRDFRHRLHHAQLAVHGGDCHQNGVRPQQLFQVVKIHRAVPPDVHKVDLVSLLLQSGQAAAHRGMLQRGGDDVLAVVALQPGDALDGKVVGLAGTGCIDDLGGLHPQAAGDALGGLVDGGLGGGTGRMAGVGIARAMALYFTKPRQHGFIHRRVRGIIQIDHRSS